MNKRFKTFLLTILALLLPPVAVFAKAGHHWQLYLNIFFCITFYIPGVIHAVFFVRHEPRVPIIPDDLDDMPPCKESDYQTTRVEPKLNW